MVGKHLVSRTDFSFLSSPRTGFQLPTHLNVFALYEPLLERGLVTKDVNPISHLGTVLVLTGAVRTYFKLESGAPSYLHFLCVFGEEAVDW